MANVIVSTSSFGAVVLLVLALLACSEGPQRSTGTPDDGAVEGPATASPGEHLRVSGTQFLRGDRSIFSWRGITAFRLLDYVADGKEAQVSEYLAWAASRRLTVVRVLAMGRGFLDLEPHDGHAALPRLLDLAARHGIYVEVVALAGTAEVPVDLKEQVSAVGRVLAGHPNGVLEIANEPVHRTQAPDVHKPQVLRALRSTVPSNVPVALGSIERGEGFADGDYITWHVPRDDSHAGWGHVLAVADGHRFLQRWRKPVVSDEPIGAGPEFIPGRRDNEPERFRAAALLTRLAGLGATFHYEGGLQATIPSGRELACFEAWNDAWRLLPEDLEQRGTFTTGGSPGAIVEGYDREATLGVYERTNGSRAWILTIGAREPRVQLRADWRVAEARVFRGFRLFALTRQAQPSRSRP